MKPGSANLGLLQDFTQKVADDSDAWLIGHQCSPYHKKTSFYPFATGIRHVALNLEGHEESDAQINRLEGFLMQNGLSLQEMIPLFAGILNINLEGSSYHQSPYSLEQQLEKIVNAIITIYLERAKKQPLLLIFEDLHWMDDYSLHVLQQLIRQSPVSRILAVFSFRPDFEIPWRMQRHLIPISLTNLSVVADAIRDCSRRGELVLDCFAGSAIQVRQYDLEAAAAEAGVQVPGALREEWPCAATQKMNAVKNGSSTHASVRLKFWRSPAEIRALQKTCRGLNPCDK